MNREILFRGKKNCSAWHADFGTWYYGDLSTSDEQQIYTTSGEVVNVFPETVGQYTGLTDRHGVKLFEGDIISVRYEEDADHYYGTPKRVWYERFEVYFDNKYHCWYARHIIDKDDTYWLYEFGEECTIIGNIHDNPELLQKGG